ncbi:MAG: DJ-1/PfpI family protein [Clostridia bacterium]|nr:DJ-1/PfpI family protein [Clostridia bacterium]
MVYVFLAEGFEIVEALAVVDVLRRAKIETATVGIGGKAVKSSNGITVTCDKEENEIGLMDDIEAIVLPGGMPGTINLDNSATVHSFLEFADEKKLLIAAICAAPSVLGKKGFLKDKKATCFPGFEEYLYGADYTGGFVEKDSNIITAKGMGVAVDFGLEIVSYLRDKQLSESIRKSIQSK